MIMKSYNYFTIGDRHFRENDDYIIYDEETNYDIMLEKYKRTDKETLVFDEFCNGDTVGIGTGVFAEHNELKNVIFPYGAKVDFDCGAFENCKGLEKLTVSEMKYDTFNSLILYGCDNLKELTLPQGTRIEENEWALPADCKVIYTNKVENDEELDLTGQTERGR